MERYKHKYTFKGHSGHPGSAWRNVTVLCEYDENAKVLAIKALALRLKNGGHKPAVKWTLELLSVERNHKLISKFDKIALRAKPTRPAPDRTLTDDVLEVLASAEHEPRKAGRSSAFHEAVEEAVEEIRAHDEATAKKLETYQRINHARRSGLLIG